MDGEAGDAFFIGVLRGIAIPVAEHGIADLAATDGNGSLGDGGDAFAFDGHFDLVEVGAGTDGRADVGGEGDGEGLFGLDGLVDGEDRGGVVAGIGGDGGRVDGGTVECGADEIDKGEAWGEGVGEDERGAIEAGAFVVDGDGVLDVGAGCGGGGRDGFFGAEKGAGADLDDFFGGGEGIAITGGGDDIAEGTGGRGFDVDPHGADIFWCDSADIPREDVARNRGGGWRCADEGEAGGKGVSEQDVREGEVASVGEGDVEVGGATGGEEGICGAFLKEGTGGEAHDGGVEVAPEVVFAVVGAAGIATEGIGIDGVAVGAGVGEDAEFDGGVFGAAELQLADGEADGVDLFGVAAGRSGGKRAVRGKVVTDGGGVDSGVTESVVQGSRGVLADLGAWKLDAFPGADFDARADFLIVGAGGGGEGIEVEGPRVAALRTCDGAGHAPGGVAATVTGVDDGSDVFATEGAELMRVPKGHDAEFADGGGGVPFADEVA